MSSMILICQHCKQATCVDAGAYDAIYLMGGAWLCQFGHTNTQPPRGEQEVRGSIASMRREIDRRRATIQARDKTIAALRGYITKLKRAK